MNAPGEIRRLCEIAEPTHGVITNIGEAHIGKLGSLDSVRKAKLEIINGTGVVVLNADDEYLIQGYEEVVKKEQINCKTITFSIHRESDVRALNIVETEYGSNFTLHIHGQRDVDVGLKVYGLFNVYNALAASAVGFSLGVPVDEIRRGLEDYCAYSMRFEVIRGKSVTLINDAYNANPASIKNAIRELICLRSPGRRVVVLGDMMELGEFSEKYHRMVGKIAADMGVDVFVGVGEGMKLSAEEFRETKKNMNIKEQKQYVYIFRNSDEARAHMSEIIKQGDVVLVKGSRLMRMERIIKGIEV
jgi:UDP-N-acetylmuramoyl-tripeptide--D-alanyl-D-alanine ligase